MLSKKEFIKILVQVETIPDDSEMIKIIHIDLNLPKSEEVDISTILRSLIIKGIIKEQMLEPTDCKVGELTNFKNNIALNVFTITFNEETFGIYSASKPKVSIFNGYDYDIKFYVGKINNDRARGE